MPIENPVMNLTVVRPDDAVRAHQPAAVEKAPGESFQSALGKAVGALDQLQTDADREVNQVAMGGGNLHEMSLALEKADITMRLATKVRNKLLDAYNDIMRMGV